ncbi:MAG: ribosome assembly RNA-binding protein YhbY [Succinivibrionaceae bacterium]|nr:ribosome assembly RNA-binding protein YhbY [Succinivibrionaceae bacterium]
MELTTKQRQYLKVKAAELKPVVMIGKNGITESVIEEIKSSIEHHELIKVKAKAEDREQRDELAQYLAEQSESTVVQFLGNNLTLFKQAKKNSKFSLPKE